VPPLRERGGDIAGLLSQFLAVTSARHGTTAPTFGRAAKAALEAYGWPGNVRELKNVVERLCLLHEGERIAVADLPNAITRPRVDDPSELLTLRLDRSLEGLTAEILERALALEGGNRTRAAKRLQVSPRTIQRHVAGRSER